MIANLFKIDSLSITCTILILLISTIVASYAKNYLKVDYKRYKFLGSIFLIATFLTITFNADNIFLFIFSWMISNLLLVKIMVHKSSWQQAKASGILALKNFTIGFICLSSALAILSLQANSYLISEIVEKQEISQNILVISCALILVAALSQSAVYPFQSWLINSLNSPTPASALMHAGIVNGGGILLAKFSQLFFQAPQILTIAFILGIISALLGTLWKLLQSNVKAMLACSTMSQMGFMIAQCAMGLFAAAIAHLFWHAMFKAYLFLSSPNSWREKRFNLRYPPSLSTFIFAIICGLFGAGIFAKINHIEIFKMQTTCVLVAVSFVAASQVALTIINNKFIIRNLIVALVISSALSALYACSVILIENIIDAKFFNPQPLNLWHIAAILLLFGAWFARLFWKTPNTQIRPQLLRLYVNTLNASQPKFQTITSNRNQYNYK